MKLNLRPDMKEKFLWVMMALSLGLLLGTLFIYLDYTNRVDQYDLELRSQMEKSNLGAEVKEENEQEDTALLPEEDLTGIADIKDRVTAGGQYSEVLASEGSRNVLLLGEDRASSLYDTICVASIDQKSKSVKLIMFPRDTYVEYSDSIMTALKEAGKSKEPGMYKLNATHYVGAMIGYKGKFSANSISFLAQVINEKFGIEIDDYVKVNTQGFTELVDLFDGVKINVPYDMNYEDPSQNLYIHLSKGEKVLNGKEAEGFVRFRQGYRANGSFFEIGDIERKKNQLSFLKAFINQHGTVSNINKLPALLKTLNKNLKHSIGFDDILLTYTGLAKDVINDKYEIETMNLDGDSKWINGSSYIVLN